jgi:hypothetical protein
MYEYMEIKRWRVPSSGIQHRVVRWQLTNVASQSSPDFQRTTRRYIPEKRTLHKHRKDEALF